MNMTVTTRPILPSDKDAWQILFVEYLAFYNTSRSQDVIDVVFQRMLTGKDNEFIGLVAEQDGVIVGFTHYLFHRKMWDIENSIYLQDLYVAAPARCKGVARLLIEAVYSAGDAAGCPKVYWLTQENNHTARTLYDRIAHLSDFVRYQR